MIPQRNLSLLANRLYKEHGGRRIPEAVRERDYCLAWFLVGLSQSKLRDLLILKRGTALKRCHFGDYRFSEDLDFTLANKMEFAEVSAGLKEVYELVAQSSGIRFSFEAKDRQTYVNSHRRSSFAGLFSYVAGDAHYGGYSVGLLAVFVFEFICSLPFIEPGAVNPSSANRARVSWCVQKKHCHRGLGQGRASLRYG